MVNEQGQEMTVRGESLGGGKVRIVEINHVKVDFTGEYSAIIVIHQDTPGVVAYITKCLSERNINIAFMRLFRESKGTTAYTIVESDGHLPEDIVESIHQTPTSMMSWLFRCREREDVFYGFQKCQGTPCSLPGKKSFRFPK